MMLLDVLLLLFIKVHLKRHIFNTFFITVFLHNITVYYFLFLIMIFFEKYEHYIIKPF